MSKNNFKIGWPFRVLHRVVIGFFTWRFNIKANITPEVQNMKGPYLLLSNHIASYDPFLVSYFLKTPPHFVSSDAIFKSPFMRFFLKGFGVIPKRKNVRDTQVIRDIVMVVRDGGAIGLFPEGSRTWSGETLHIEPSTAKLIKLLKIPVIVAKMKGVYWINPRWGFKVRRAAGEIDYTLAFTADEVQAATAKEVMDKVRTLLYHNEIDYQRQAKTKIKANHRAEHLGFLLFACPNCETIGSIQGKGNDFACRSCGQAGIMNEYGFLESQQPTQLAYDNLYDWYNWEKKWLEDKIELLLAEQSKQAVFVDKAMTIYEEQDNKLVAIGKADTALYLDRIECTYASGEQLIIPLVEIEALNPQFHERIEIFYNQKSYRIANEIPGVSGLKWEIAVNHIWRNTRQAQKVSTYMK